MNRQAVSTGSQGAGDSRRRPVRFWLAVTLGAVGAFAATVGAVGPSTVAELQALPIRSVRVGGELEHISRAELERAIGTHLDAGFFSVDVEAVAGAAMALPWIANVSVRRVWPDSLHIAIIERNAVARWDSGGLVSANGDVFEPSHPEPLTEPTQGASVRGRSVQGGSIQSDLVQRLPSFAGPPGTSARVLETWRAATRSLHGVGGGIRAIALSERGIWRITTKSGMGIVFREGQLDDLASLARIYDPVLGRRAQDIARIDLRYTNGFAVRWKPGAGKPPAAPETAAGTTRSKSAV